MYAKSAVCVKNRLLEVPALMMHHVGADESPRAALAMLTVNQNSGRSLVLRGAGFRIQNRLAFERRFKNTHTFRASSMYRHTSTK